MIETQRFWEKAIPRQETRRNICAVDQVSFCCRPGEIYGLLGANGAGKNDHLAHAGYTF